MILGYYFITVPKLMIKYNVGVSEEDAYIVKRLDTDFFLEEF